MTRRVTERIDRATTTPTRRQRSIVANPEIQTERLSAIGRPPTTTQEKTAALAYLGRTGNHDIVTILGLTPAKEN